MFGTLGTLGWSDNSDHQPAEPYSRSGAVRDWLVYTALVGNNMPLTANMRASQEDAFARVFEGVRRGAITLDYSPAEDAVVDIPPINHPHYMQAMLYWCVRLDCTISVLSEAYAQLGRAAPVQHLRMTTRRVRIEEEKTRKIDNGWQRTQGHSNGPAATLPMSRP